jgi:hypothetical protein
MAADQLLAYIRENKNPIGWVTLKSDNYLIPVTDNVNSEKSVIVDGVQELTPAGNELFKKILYAYEKGLESRI